jgi:hypothetical protein
MTEARHGGMRILVGAGSFADAAAALKILKTAMRKGEMTLGGMLIVDQQALALCRIPNQRFISGTGALAISPSPGRVTALIDADAKAFRKSLAELADPIGATWLFEQTMGDLVGDVLKARAAWDVIVFGQQRTHRTRGKIVVIAERGTQHEEISAFADTLAGQNAAERLDLIVGESPASEAAPAALKTFETTLETLSRTSMQAVLLNLSDDLAQNTAALHKLLDAARCPVFIFNARFLKSQEPT